MGYFFSTFETARSKVADTSLCPISPGQYIICRDSGDVFYDTEDGVRKHLTDIIDLETDAERTAILAPLDKMYFVKETTHFWRYLNGEWVDLSNATANSVYSKVFNASVWSDGKIVIPASEHRLLLKNKSVLAKVYMLKNGEYADDVLAVMGTSVSVDANESVVLSYSGTGYAGKVVLCGNTVAEEVSGGGTYDHRMLENRDAEDQHPIEAISGLKEISNLDVLKIWNGV